MAFAKQAVKKVEEDIDAAMEASIEREAVTAEGTPAATAEAASDTVGVANETVNELPEADEVKPEEDNDLSASPAESLDDQLLAGGGMELSDDTIDPPAHVVEPAPVEAAPAETGAAVENVDADAPAADEVAPAGTKPRLERIVGNGSPLSPNAQRKAAQAEKDAARQGYGGGGGGGIGSLFAAAGSGAGAVLKGVGRGVMFAGGQKLADRLITPSDPISVAKRLQRERYNGFNKALTAMGDATVERAKSVDIFNGLVARSAPGRTLSDIADASGTKLHDLMSDVKSGKNGDPLAVRCVESLGRDPVLGQAAKNIGVAEEAFISAQKVAETNFNRLAADHAADINVTTEYNRMVDKVEQAETDIKKPLPLEASLKNSETGAEEKIDTEKQHKKFMEALDKIKESIAALLQKIMSKLGMGGPK